MKKLIALAAAIALAGVASAASVNWKISAGTAYKSQTYYLVENVTAATLAEAFSSTTASAWNLSGYTIESTGTLSSKGVKNATDTTAPGSYAVVILDNGFTEGGNWAIMEASTSGYTYEGASAAFTLEMKTVSQTGTFQSIPDVPEPTSGLLLLVGMAGLALKRKVA